MRQARRMGASQRRSVAGFFQKERAAKRRARGLASALRTARSSAKALS